MRWGGKSTFSGSYIIFLVFGRTRFFARPFLELGGRGSVGCHISYYLWERHIFVLFFGVCMGYHVSQVKDTFFIHPLLGTGWALSHITFILGGRQTGRWKTRFILFQLFGRFSGMGNVLAAFLTDCCWVSFLVSCLLSLVS